MRVNRKSGRIRTARLEAFSDGVFAIAITLLVLDIAVPSGSSNLLRSFAAEWPVYLAYFVSFATIGAIWLGHNVMTEYLHQADMAFTRLNLLLLLLVSFLPFPTRLLAEYISDDQGERIAITIYGVNLLLASVLLSVMWRYCIRAGLVRPDAADKDVEVLTKRLTPSVGGYVLLIVAGLFPANTGNPGVPGDCPVLGVAGRRAATPATPCGASRHRLTPIRRWLPRRYSRG